jgi:hypothetical protein
MHSCLVSRLFCACPERKACRAVLDKRILPSLPDAELTARLAEKSGLLRHLCQRLRRLQCLHKLL